LFEPSDHVGEITASVRRFPSDFIHVSQDANDAFNEDFLHF